MVVVVLDFRASSRNKAWLSSIITQHSHFLRNTFPYPIVFTIPTQRPCTLCYGSRGRILSVMAVVNSGKAALLSSVLCFTKLTIS